MNNATLILQNADKGLGKAVFELFQKYFKRYKVKTKTENMDEARAVLDSIPSELTKNAEVMLVK